MNSSRVTSSQDDQSVRASEPAHGLEALERAGVESMRSHLAAIVDSSDDAILSKALDGTILSWNKSAERLYGYTALEIIGKSVSVLVPDERAGEVEQILTHIKAGELIDHFETERVAKDGTVVPVSLTISPIKDSSGKIVAASTIARDTTERREADELRFHLAAIVDSSDDAILSKALDGTILSWNKSAERLYGYAAEEIIGKSVSVLVPDERAGEVEQILTHIKAGELIDHFETERVAKDGTVVPVSLTISPIKDSSGKIVAASTIARDTTERRRLEAQLEAARDQALDASRHKSDFLATMSHEIRTPMNGVIGMTGLLLDTELDPEQRDFAETVCTSGEALLSIINDILDFSKIEAGGLELDVVDFDLRTVVEEVGAILAERAHAKGLELATVVAPDLVADVRGDPGRLRQVLTNLAGNAIKFTEAGEVVVRAEVVREDAEELLVRFEVADTGIGIPAEAQEALFEPFAQADASTTRTYGGTGLGLAISKQLAEYMGGEIGLESVVGEGSRFSFTVPLGKQAKLANGRAAKRADLTGMRVLIVDDNATNRKILELQASSWGMESTSAPGGEAALEALCTAAGSGDGFDLALLDMQMPDMDGITLAEAIRSEPSLQSIPLVLLTSSGLRGSSEQARQAGISAYLTKPVRQAQLFDAITTVIGACSPSGRSAVGRGPASQESAGSRPRLLVAEDNPVNQKVALAMLDKLGYDADVASNGAEAIEAFSRGRYGAVLMDCQMPEMDGYAATTEIRRSEQGTARIPIIAMTASVVEGEQEKCLAAGMDDYISKPVATDALESALGRWVEPGTETAEGATGAPERAPANGRFDSGPRQE